MGSRHNLGLMPFKDPQKQKAASARYYQENKDALWKRTQKKRGLWKKRTEELKSNTPCLDCGLQYPHYVMDFDHRPDAEKRFNISHAGSITSTQALEEEIAKCDVVCANCHRHRTFMRNVGKKRSVSRAGPRTGC